MNVIDFVIIIIVLGCGLLGLKRGLTRELVSFLGFFIVIVLSFYLKNPLSKILYTYLPFIKFGGIFKGVIVINILVYEIISFFIIMSLLTVVLKVFLFATKVFEKLLTITIVLGIPSKILGCIVGILEGVVWAFILIYILSLPTFNNKEVHNSKLSKELLSNTVILSNFTKDFKKVTDEIVSLKKEYNDNNINTDTFNYEALNSMLEYNVIDVDSVKILKEKGKLDFKNLDSLIKKYGDEK